MTANPPEPLGWTSEDWFRQLLIAAVAAEGLHTEWYSTHPATAGDLRLFMGGVQPGTKCNVNGLRNAVSLLLESRGAARPSATCFWRGGCTRRWLRWPR